MLGSSALPPCFYRRSVARCRRQDQLLTAYVGLSMPAASNQYACSQHSALRIHNPPVKWCEEADSMRAFSLSLTHFLGMARSLTFLSLSLALFVAVVGHLSELLLVLAVLDLPLFGCREIPLPGLKCDLSASLMVGSTNRSLIPPLNPPLIPPPPHMSRTRLLPAESCLLGRCESEVAKLSTITTTQHNNNQTSPQTDAPAHR